MLIVRRSCNWILLGCRRWVVLGFGSFSRGAFYEDRERRSWVIRLVGVARIPGAAWYCGIVALTRIIR